MKRRRPCPVALALGCAGAFLAALAGLPSLAGAVVVSLPGQGNVSIVPRVSASPGATGDPLASALRESGQLQYYGGPVMTGQASGGPVHVYTIYWAPSNGGVAFPAGFETGVNRYVADVAADDGKTINTFSVLAQYYQTAGAVTTHIAYDEAFAGTFDDTDPIAGTRAQCPLPSDGVDCITDATEHQELLSLIDARSLPENLSTLYEVFLPPGLVVCSDQGGSYCGGTAGPDGAFCGEHGSLSDSATGDTVIDTLTTWDHLSGCENAADPTTPVVDDAVTEIAHEWSEALTDPEPTTDRAWMDGFGNEIADLCNADEFDQLGSTGLGAFNQWIGGDPWEVQAMWDNASSSCRERETPAPKASFSVTAPAPYPDQPVTVDAGASSTYDGAVVAYRWSFGDGAGAQGPTPPAHVYAQPGAYPITLTVTDDQGDIDQQVQTVQITPAPGPVDEPSPPPVAGGNVPVPVGNVIDGAGHSAAQAIAPFTAERTVYAAFSAIGAGTGAAWLAGPQLSAGDRGPFEFAIPTADPGVAGIADDPRDAALLFTEQHADKLGAVQAGRVSEFPLATPDAQPAGISAVRYRFAAHQPPTSAGEVFAEFHAGALVFARLGGETVAVAKLPDSAAGPFGVVPGPDGNVWFTEMRASRIGRLTPGGQLTEFSLPSGSIPGSITAGADGALWFVELGGNAIGRITTQGQISQFPIGLPHAFVRASGKRSPTHGTTPEQIVAGGDGALWFVEGAAGRIGRITTTGHIRQIRAAGPGVDPAAITRDPSRCGRLWYTEITPAQLVPIQTPCVTSPGPEPLAAQLVADRRAGVITIRLRSRGHIGVVAERVKCAGPLGRGCRPGAPGVQVVPGRQLAIGSLGTFAAGTHRVRWDGAFGRRRLGPGRYLIQLRVLGGNGEPRRAIPGPYPIELTVAHDGDLTATATGHTTAIHLLGPT